MTTLKELKELDAKATIAIDNLKHNQGQLDMDGCMVSVSRQAVCETIAFTEHASNALPELIRVIELAEEALKQVNEKSHFVPAIVQEAISEIRKLKGE